MAATGIFASRRISRTAALLEQHRFDGAVEVVFVEDHFGHLEVLSKVDGTPRQPSNRAAHHEPKDP
jgi:hypothetical protein